MTINISQWKYRQKFTIPIANTVYKDITNFPVLLVWTGTAGTSSLPEEMFNADGATPAKSNGGDIRFTLDKYGVNELPFEISHFSTNNDPSLARAEIWVKIPNIYAAVAATFYMWWGNADAVAYSGGDPYGWRNAWDSSFVFVHHLGANTTPLYDSSQAAINSSSIVNNTREVSKIYYGRLFDSSSSPAYIGFDNTAALNMTTGITLSAWVKATDWLTSRRIIQKGTTDNQYRLTAEAGALKFECVGLTTTSVSSVLPGTGAWHLVHATYDGSNLRIYIDGQLSATQAATGSIATSTDALNIGHKPGSASKDNSFLGSIDECRIANVALSAAWIEAEYFTQNAPYGFVTQGIIEALTPLTGYNRRVVVTNDRTKLGSDEVNLNCPFIWTGSQATSNLPEEMMDANSGFSAQSDGRDIRFSSDINGLEQLAFEIVSFSTNNDPTLARAEIWVQVKFLSAAVNTPIYLWYKNASASAVGNYDAQGKQSCWSPGDTSIISVHHMIGTGNVDDSTLNGWTLVNNGSTSDANGKFTVARAFNGSSQYLSSNTSACVIPNDFSIAFWVKTTATSRTGTQWWSGDGLVDAERTGAYNDNGISYLNSKVAFGIGNSDTTIQSVGTINDGNWHYVVATRKQSTGAMALYLDNAAAVTGTGPTAARSTAAYYVGKIYQAAQYFNGSIDELWVGQTVLASTRVTSMYNSQNNVVTFWSLGTPNWGDNFPMRPFGRMFMPAANFGFDRIL